MTSGVTETMKGGPEDAPSSQRLWHRPPTRLVLLPGAVFALVMMAYVYANNYFLREIHAIPHNHSSADVDDWNETRVASPCERAIVYHKPPKTASTSIQRELQAWAREKNRKFYGCSGYKVYNHLRARSCFPSQFNPCAVISFHFTRTPLVSRLLDSIDSNALQMSSTRHPRQRLVSMYLQKYGLHVTDRFVLNESDFRVFLREMNRWHMYNYHSGEAVPAGTGFTNDAFLRMVELASEYDVVVDLNLPEASNVILAHHGLFQLDGGKRVNNRNSGAVRMGKETEKLFEEVSHIELMFHRALQMRMALLYERATKRTCVPASRNPELNNCIVEQEAALLTPPAAGDDGTKHAAVPVGDDLPRDS